MSIFIIMDRLEELFKQLADEKWHQVEEMTRELGWPIGRTLAIVDFLAAHGLLLYRKETRSVKLDDQFRELLLG